VNLAVLTAVSRPENLSVVAGSLARAAERAPNVHVAWRWVFDTPRTQIGGQALKNQMLDNVRGGYVWCLDDDTLVHPDVLLDVEASIQGRPRVSRAVIVSQQRTSGDVLHARPENICVGGVDIGQAFLRRDLIGDRRIPIDYNGDGLFLEAVLRGERNVVYLDKVLSLHNAISGVEVSV
jgi:hypothetical protein